MSYLIISLNSKNIKMIGPFVEFQDKKNKVFAYSHLLSS